MIVTRTPLRISFAGGGTDLPSFYKHNEFGSVFSSSIDKYLYVVVKRHSELFPESLRLNYSETEQVNDVEQINNPIIRECLKYLSLDERLYISTIADAPGSSGLGSSSSFCVGLLCALYAFLGRPVSRARLAEEAAHIEIDLLGRPIGKQDHFSAAYGGINYFKFHSDHTTSMHSITNSEFGIRLLFHNLATFWTGVQRQSSEVLSEQNSNKDKNRQTLLQMRDQAWRLFNHTSQEKLDLAMLGEELHRGWEMKKSLASKVSNESIDKMYQYALSAGALGGKISGAGGGGFLSVVVNPSKREALIKKMEENGMVYFPLKADVSGVSLLVDQKAE